MASWPALGTFRVNLWGKYGNQKLRKDRRRAMMAVVMVMMMIVVVMVVMMRTFPPALQPRQSEDSYLLYHLVGSRRKAALVPQDVALCTQMESDWPLQLAGTYHNNNFCFESHNETFPTLRDAGEWLCRVTHRFR
jgi:hypothetical protein